MNWQFNVSDCPESPSHPVEAYQVYENGIKKGPFYLTMDDLISSLSQETEIAGDADGKRDEEKNTPPLPFGTIRYAVTEDNRSERVTVEIPQKQWEIRYGNEEETFYSIGFPRMVVQYLVVNSRVQEMRIYAVANDGKPITEDTQLYKFPYPNVAKYNGIVCWGQNERLGIKSLIELERAFQWFVSAPFNEDHGVATTLKSERFISLLHEIQDKPFQDDWLIPLTNVYRDLFNQESL